MTEKLSLRPLDFQPVIHHGQQMWLLYDPLQLSDYQLIVPPGLAQLLIYFDGTRTARQIYQAFTADIGQAINFALIEDTIAQLDKACLLDNERALAAQQHLLQLYRAQPHRPPTLADLSYPANPAELSDLFAEYGEGDTLNGWQPFTGRGIISPHIDYQRGGPVYAKVWRRAIPAVLAADLVVILGTDHNGGPGSFTLTHQPYATPYGVLPTDTALIDSLVATIGPEAAFGAELHHRAEHSIELSAVWLHHVYRKAGVAPKPMVPILIGSFYNFIRNGTHPAHDSLLQTALDCLRRETAGKRVVFVASVDFAHVGPAFGDNFAMDSQRRRALQAVDDQLVCAIVSGDAAEFYDQIAAVRDKNRVCGFAPIYLLLELLGKTAGLQVAYEQCSADIEDASLVSICGILLE